MKDRVFLFFLLIENNEELHVIAKALFHSDNYRYSLLSLFRTIFHGVHIYSRFIRNLKLFNMVVGWPQSYTALRCPEKSADFGGSTGAVPAFLGTNFTQPFGLNGCGDTRT